MSAAERRPAAIVCAGLRNFTRLSEALEPGRVLALANEFFALAAHCADACSGRPQGMHNDAVVLAFADGGSASQAFQAAQMLLREFEPVGERWKHEFGLPAAVAIGLHLGETVFGMAGPPQAEQAIALGDSVSIAERLMHRARAGEIVLSAEVMRSVGGSSGARPLPALEVARRPPLLIYGVLLDNRLDFT